jgi:hypothetical protein
MVGWINFLGGFRQMNGFLLCSVLFVGQYATGGGESQWLIDFPVDSKPAPVNIDTSKPYVIFIKVEASDVAGVQSVRDDNYDTRGVFIVMPGNQWHRVNDVSDVAYELRRLGVGRPASFFVPSSSDSNPSDRSKSGLPRTADDSLKVSGRWPSMARLEGMERYEPAKLTQSIFKWTGNPLGQIRGVSRSMTEEKYQVPGGLVGVKGWRSELYRYTPKPSREWIDFTSVVNGIRLFDPKETMPKSQYESLYKDHPTKGFSKQSEVAHMREYPDGSEFDDVLINTETGKVFEHRVAQKHDGQWERFVAYRDRSQMPSGYVPPKSKDCVTCHLEAGSGRYGKGMVPGGDTILSDPFRDFPTLGEEQQIQIR